MLAKSVWLVSATIVSVAAVHGYKNWHSAQVGLRPSDAAAKYQSPTSFAARQELAQPPRSAVQTIEAGSDNQIQISQIRAENAHANPERPLTFEENQELENGRTAASRGDFNAALRILGPFALQGHAKAQYAMGNMYATGSGLSRNPEQAMGWWALAARQGHSHARYYLCRASMNGDNRAYQLNREAADAYALKTAGRYAPIHPSTHSLEEFQEANKNMTMREAMFIMSITPKESADASCKRFAGIYE